MKKERTQNIKHEDQFLEVEIPNFDLLKIKLVQDTQQVYSFDQLKHESHNFTISFDTSNIGTRKDMELSKQIMALTKMNFVEYDNRNSTYRYFTNQYTGDTEYKKKLLKDILGVLKEYEQTKIAEMAQGKNEFDAMEKQVLETDVLLVNYLPKSKLMAVTLKGYAGRDVFINLLSVSEQISIGGTTPKNIKEYEAIKSEFNMSDIRLDEFVELLKQENHSVKLKGKPFFLIKPERYMALKKIIGAFEQTKTLLHNESISEKNVLIANGTDIRSVEVVEDNDFNLYIKYNEEYGAYEFNCLGYSSVYSNGFFFSSFGRHIKTEPTSVLGVFAKNFIYGKYTEDVLRDSIKPCQSINSNSLIESREVIKLDKIEQKKDSNFLIPLKEFEKLQTIKNNYTHWNHIFGRESIKIAFKGRRLPLVITEKAPLIFTNGGDVFFVLKMIEKTRRSTNDSNQDSTGEDNTKHHVTLIGKKISIKEMEYFFEEHDMSPIIKKNSYYLISILNLGVGANLTDENIQRSYENVMLSLKLHQQMSETNTKNISKKVGNVKI